MDPVPTALLGHAAIVTQDEAVLKVAEGHVDFARTSMGTTAASGLRKHLQAPLRAVLPERLPEEAEHGYTIQRDEAKVGRNDPCPCGSGKKYKRCCASGGSTSRPPVAPREEVSPYRRTMTS